MQRVTTGGLRTLRQSHIISDLLVHLPGPVARRNMSSSPVKRPVSLLGTMAFGGRADAEQSLAMVQTFLGRGHNHLDTAFMYVDGKSEPAIGGMALPKTGISGAEMLDSPRWPHRGVPRETPYLLVGRGRHLGIMGTKNDPRPLLK